MSKHRQKTVALLGFCLLLLAAACTRTPPVRLYLLSAGKPATLAMSEAAERIKAVGLGPVTLPDYLDRPQIVTRVSENRLEASDSHRWAEPLAGNLTRALQENLAALLAPVPVLSYPWKPAQMPPVQVRVDVLRFEAGPDQAMHLVARWMIVNADGAALLEPQRIELQFPADLLDHEGRSAAASEALMRLSREIATGLCSHFLNA